MKSLLLVLTLMLASCGIKFNEEEKSNPQVKLQDHKDERLGWNREPNSYYYDLSLLSDDVEFELSDSVEVLKSGRVGRLENKRLILPSGNTFIIELHYADGSEETLPVKVPTDLMLTQKYIDETYKDQKKIEIFETRVFLIDQALVLNGKNLKIHTRDLTSVSSEIQSFSNYKAPPGEKGKNGSQVEISADFATGDLFINTRAQDGGDGIRPPKNPAQHPIRGADTRHWCKRENWKHLEPPLNGAPGFDANNGLRAGNSGGLKFKKTKAGNLSLTFDISSAFGGKPSLPGLGGDGQRGYPDPRVCEFDVPWCKCISELQKEGRPGPSGQPGVKGADGKEGKVCLELDEIKTEEGCKL